MILAILAVVLGLAVLVWSADKFVDGAVGVARFLGMSSLLIGIIIVGFGTSAPEMVVSAISAMDNAPELALGNAYGSNIANIALILGVTALISPVIVKREALKKDMPILIFVSILAYILAMNGSVSRLNSIAMLLLFAFIMIFDIWFEKKHSQEQEEKQEETNGSLSKSIFLLVLGLILLVASSRALVWGAIFIARHLGVSDLIIGLTIVAIGTSLPELASSIAAARKGQDDLALGNIVGSNLFNTLAVVGIAGVITPMNTISSDILSRDLPIMILLTVLLLIFGLPVKKRMGNRIGRINRLEGLFFTLAYAGYILLLIMQSTK